MCQCYHSQGDAMSNISTADFQFLTGLLLASLVLGGQLSIELSWLLSGMA
jgi:hypothetical protein